MLEQNPWLTRSLSRRGGQGHSGLKRPYWLRLLVLCAMGAGLYWLALSITERAYDPNGPGRVLYLLHDEVYLWLQGIFWTQFFPVSLIWIVPLSALLLLLLAEFLTPLGTRGLQRSFLRWLATKPALHWVFPGHWGFSGHWVFPRGGVRSWIDSDRWRAIGIDPDALPSRLGGFSLRVVLELHSQAWQDLRESHGAAGGSKKIDELSIKAVRSAANSLKLALRLAPENPRVVLAIVELIAVNPKTPTVARLRSDLERHLEQLLINWDGAALELAEIKKTLDLLAGTTLPLSREARAGVIRSILHESAALIAISDQAEPAPGPVVLAVRAIRVAAVAQLVHSHEARLFFEQWVSNRARTDDDEAGDVFAQAETLIDFAFWARLAEDADRRSAAFGLPDGALPGLDELYERPERFAWDGTAA